MSKLSESTIEKLGYYVYLLIDPRTKLAFYVGKGCGNRINHHLLDALVADTGERKKIQTILDIQKDGLDVGLVILRHGLTEKEAFEVEATMIDYIGRNSLTNLVLGHHAGDRGLMSLDDIKIKYEAEEAIFNEAAILINVNKRYARGMSSNEIYEITRSAWRINIQRANSIRLVCSVYRGIIREVFIADRWLPHDSRQGRSYFEGKVAPPKLRERYLYKSVAKYWKQGSQSPVKYVG
jgi:hypothetical protein